MNTKLKKLPVKKTSKPKAAKASKPKAKKSLPVAKKAVKKVIKKTAPKKTGYVKTNKPPALLASEEALVKAGKWMDAAKAHQKRTGVLFRRSLVAVAPVYRTQLQAVLSAIKAELKAGR